MMRMMVSAASKSVISIPARIPRKGVNSTGTGDSASTINQSIQKGTKYLQNQHKQSFFFFYVNVKICTCILPSVFCNIPYTCTFIHYYPAIFTLPYTCSLHYYCSPTLYTCTLPYNCTLPYTLPKYTPKPYLIHVPDYTFVPYNIPVHQCPTTCTLFYTCNLYQTQTKSVVITQHHLILKQCHNREYMPAICTKPILNPSSIPSTI